MKVTIENGPTTIKTTKEGWIFSSTVETPAFKIALTIDFTQEELAVIERYDLASAVVYTEKNGIGDDPDLKALARKFPESAHILDRPMNWRLEYFMRRPLEQTFMTPGKANDYEQLLRATTADCSNSRTSMSAFAGRTIVRMASTRTRS